MRSTPFIYLPLLLMCVGLACQEPNANAPTKAPAAASTPDKVPAEPSASTQAMTQVEKALKMANHPFQRAEVAVTDAQLEAIVASSYEVFETTEDPRVRVFVFHYDAQELVKPAKVARWINEKGLIHHGQTSANRLRVIVAGTPEAGALEGSCTGGGESASYTDKASCEGAGQTWKDGAIGVMNDFMDAFMVMR